MTIKSEYFSGIVKLACFRSVLGLGVLRAATVLVLIKLLSCSITVKA